MVIIEQTVLESEPVVPAGSRLVGRTWGALGRSAATESEKARLPRPETSSFDRGIGMRDVHKRADLERIHGHPATVDPACFFREESPAAAGATQKQPPLDLWNLGADTSDGGYDDATASTVWSSSPPGSSDPTDSPGGGTGLDPEVEWDDMFRDITAAAIAPTSPPSEEAPAPVGSSGAIGGRVYDADNERACSRAPMFAEVGRPSEETAARKGTGCDEAPNKAGSGRGGEACFGGGKACFGGGRGGLWGDVPSHHGSNGHDTANMSLVEVRPNHGRDEDEVVDEDFHGLFGPTGGKDPIAEYFSERARRLSAAERVEAATAGPSVKVEETSPGGESLNSGGAAAVSTTQKPGATRPTPDANAVFSKSLMGVEAGAVLIASEGGGGESSSTPPGQDVGDANWPDSVGWLLSDTGDSPVSEAETRAEEGTASGTGSFDEVVEDAGSWGESSHSGGADGGDTTMLGTNLVFASAVPGAEASIVQSGGGGGGGSPRLPTPRSEEREGVDMHESVKGLFAVACETVAVTVAGGGEAAKAAPSDEIVEDAWSWGGSANAGGGGGGGAAAAAAANGEEGRDAPLLGTDSVLTKTVPGAEARAGQSGGGGGSGGGSARLPEPAGQDREDIDIRDSIGWLFAIVDDPEMSEAVVAAEDGEAAETIRLDEVVEVAAPRGESATAEGGAPATPSCDQGGGDTVSSTGAERMSASGFSGNEAEPEEPPASVRTVPNAEATTFPATGNGGGGGGGGGGRESHPMTPGGGDGVGAAASSATTAAPASTTSSWLGSAAGLMRAATTVIAAALSKGEGSSTEKVRMWKSPPGGDPRLGAYPGAFPCRRQVRGELRVRQRRPPAVHYSCLSGGRWVERDDAAPWMPQPMRHVLMESRTPCV